MTSAGLGSVAHLARWEANGRRFEVRWLVTGGW